MESIRRREFLRCTALSAAAGSVALFRLAPQSLAAQAQRRMTLCLSGGAIGVSANQREAVELASRHGFEAVEANAGNLAGLAAEQLEELQAAMKAKGIVFGAAGLPVDFRQVESRFREGLQGLPRIASALQRAGVTRVSTWIMSGHDTLTYRSNFRQHAARLREVALLLKDHGLRLGLEYVGPKTVWSNKRYPFIHTMTEMRELIAEIGTGNVGLLMDSFHWWTSGETETDLLTLNNEEVVSVDLNDAAAGLAREQQIDSQRELPCATGVIPVAAFLNALQRIGYDGPVRAEPFNKALNALDNEEACAATAKAMNQAFALIQ